MPKSFYRRYWLFTLISLTIPAVIQSNPVVSVSPSPAPEVNILSLIETPESSLSDLKQTGNLAHSVAVVSNQSEQPIVAISALWRITTVDGVEHRFRQKCDVFLANASHKYVVAPKSILYLGPNTCVAEKSPPINLSEYVSRLERSNVNMLSDSVQVAIIVDAIMFENGDMYANDSSYATELKARVAAGRALASHVRAGFASGKNRDEVVAELSAATPGRLGEEGAWFRDFTSELSRKPDKQLNAFVSGLENLKLPNLTMRKK